MYSHTKLCTTEGVVRGCGLGGVCGQINAFWMHGADIYAYNIYYALKFTGWLDFLCLRTHIYMYCDGGHIILSRLYILAGAIGCGHA